MREGQKRINVYLPESLYSSVLNSEYKDITTAVIKGLEKLLEPPREDSEKIHTNTQEGSNSLQNELILSLKNHIASLESQIRVKDEQLRTQAVHLQTVLTQKAISAPSGSRTTKEEKRESRPTQNEEIKNAPVKRSHWEGKEATIEKICKNPECKQKTFLAKNPKQEYCSRACKTAYGRKKEKQGEL